MRLAVQFDVRPDLDFNTVAEAVTNYIESRGYLIALESGDDYTWVGTIEDVPEEEADKLRDKIEDLLADIGGDEYNNVLILDGVVVPTVETPGPRGRISPLAERLTELSAGAGSPPLEAFPSRDGPVS